MEESVQLPPIPAKMLGISRITVEEVRLASENEFLITVKSSKKAIKCKKRYYIKKVLEE